ncbi:multidrug ABC transporter ATPase [Protaetiibacter mangrovi]|uniref:Multidrug ABC transporter ATPase n=1 Tax=Protaetiibacter mangrovi TaxID=2970926 RepID=A0ABT1ZDP5_9MICO|nr:multidrug ABC transporter ATPase [Protaetiibacter mangrovi]MCS0498825.1 multidrug ABC transporter ATPase [Protaetiibacter mangrovi]TPW91974.1 multidrug ABC transporter ATPase [Schumannella luteola]
MPENAPVPLNRIERVLAAMIAAIVGISIIAIVATMIAASSGAEMSGGIWPALVLVGYIGLPLAFLLIVAFLVVSTVRRRRLDRDGER